MPKSHAVATLIRSLTAAFALSFAFTATVARAENSDVVASTSSIVGGRSASQTQLYSTVQIRYRGVLDYEDAHLCTGTLVSPTVVISAAHCFDGDDPADFVVSAGHRNGKELSKAQTVRVRKIIVHPSYKDDSRTTSATGMYIGNDIAVLLLKSPITKVPSAPIFNSTSTLHKGDTLVPHGFGLSDIRNPNTAGVLRVTFSNVHSWISTEVTTNGPGDTCYGDSGGPLYRVSPEGRAYLVGITSRARTDSSVECGAGGIYTLAYPYYEWISRVSGAEFKPVCSITSTAPLGTDPFAMFGLFAVLALAVRRRTALVHRTK